MEDSDSYEEEIKPIQWTYDQQTVIDEVIDDVCEVSTTDTKYIFNTFGVDFSVEEIAYVIDYHYYNLLEAREAFESNNLPKFPDDIPKGKFRLNSSGLTNEQLAERRDRMFKEMFKPGVNPFKELPSSFNNDQRFNNIHPNFNSAHPGFDSGNFNFNNVNPNFNGSNSGSNGVNPNFNNNSRFFK
jgi:hypothetical protein